VTEASAVTEASTVGALVAQNAALRPDAIAFVEAASGETMTWRDYDRRADAIASGLVDAGYRRGDRLAVHLVDGPAVHAAYVGCERAGVIAVGIGPRAGPREVAHLMERTGAVGIVRSLDEHPLRRLWDAGTVVSVNTDDPGFFGSDLVSEYAIAGRLLDLDRRGYARLAANAVDGSFAPEAVKAELHDAIHEWARRG